MGMDLFGQNPKINSQAPQEINWDKSTDEEQDKYLKAYSKWQAENPGNYFRNNVWHWRPLWEYICFVCDDTLTKEDVESGNYNDGHLINKTKAEAIAHKLETLLLEGSVQRYADKRQEHLDQLDKDDWDKNYPFSVDNVKEFLAFVRDSGGFKIC
tara:strand:+ start:926 stop:1390 length:465 start_codon:yes stop_codon:yes gene_type:complete